VDQAFLPPEVEGTCYYLPYNNGYEARIKEWLDKRRKKA
jgi:putative ATPase